MDGLTQGKDKLPAQPYQGSSWGRWDLHFHTPASYDYKNKSVSNEEIVEKLVAHGVRVVAVTDHHFMDVPRIQELQEIGKEKGLTVLPGIEFTADQSGGEPIHFIGILPEDCDLEHIWENISVRCKITPKDVKERGGEQSLYCSLKDTSKIIEEHGGLITIHAGKKSNSIENITNTLPWKMALKKELVLNHVQIFELGQEKDKEGYEKHVFKALDKPLPMVICSDNHNIRDYQVKQNLWIKADPTFEGLKQILHEPVSRVKIQEKPPVPPARRIETLSIDFPEKTKIFIRGEDNSHEPSVFCFRGVHTVHFSPFFTCLIGGRGSGKSTILSLLAEKLKGETDFFQNNFLRGEHDDKLDPKEWVEVETTSSSIEFVSQNEIEGYANNEELTDAVYDRLKSQAGYDDFEELEEGMKRQLLLIDEQVEAINQRHGQRQELAELKKNLEENQKIISSYASDEYKALTSTIDQAGDQLQQLQKSKEDYKQLVTQLEEVRNGFTQVDAPKNDYDEALNEILAGLSRLLEEKKKFEKANTQEEQLRAKIKGKRDALDQYLQKQGVSVEDIEDYERAAVKIPELKAEIQATKDSLKKLEAEIQARSEKMDGLDQAQQKFEDRISGEITKLNEELVGLNPNVEDISFKYQFDKKKAEDYLLEEFNRHFVQYKPVDLKTRWDALRDYLFCVPPEKIEGRSEYLESLSRYGNYTNAKKFLEELFNEEVHFETYRLLIKKAFSDVNLFKSIRGYYGKKDLRKCSFGQRCTAVIVALIMFGNRPLIIDEPEAHLDSKLIAEYLVELVKTRKTKRQIIFATHNANFVVNGDAELINILEVDGQNKTRVIPTSIENMKYRENLLALEGGEEAFRKRDKRLIR